MGKGFPSVLGHPGSPPPSAPSSTVAPGQEPLCLWLFGDFGQSWAPEPGALSQPRLELPSASEQ